MLYDQSRYANRGKFAESRFERDCLAEYAGVFKTVCVDAAYYKFPDRRYLDGMTAQVPADFQFAFKVTDELTVKRFKNLPQFGARAGQPNTNFLNADLFTRAFLAPCEEFRSRFGVLIFEFSRFWPSDYKDVAEFIAALDTFLGQLPKGWHYAIQMRNNHLLEPDYFAWLARHGVTHVFNSWEAMAPVSEQLALPGSFTIPSFWQPASCSPPPASTTTPSPSSSPTSRSKRRIRTPGQRASG